MNGRAPPCSRRSSAANCPAFPGTRSAPQFGPYRYITVKNPERPPAYAFIEYGERSSRAVYTLRAQACGGRLECRHGGQRGSPASIALLVAAAEDPRDASEAVRRRDGVEFMGSHLRVEISKGGTGRAAQNFQPPPSRGNRVIVQGLPRAASWQDLKVIALPPSLPPSGPQYCPGAGSAASIHPARRPCPARHAAPQDHVRMACKPSYTDVRVDRNGDPYGVVEFETYEDMQLAIRKLDDTEFKNP